MSVRYKATAGEQKAITKKPSMKMKAVGVPTRNGNVMTCKFEPKDKADDNRNDRATHLHIEWVVYARDKGFGGKAYKFGKLGEKDNVAITETSDSYTVGGSNDKYNPYPSKGNHVIERIECMVCLRNKKGLGPYTTKVFNVLNPEKPNVSVEYSEGVVTFTITQDHPETGNAPCSRTEWYMEWGNDNKKNTGFKHKTGVNSNTQFSVTFRRNDFQDLEGDLGFVRLKARGQGWGGDGNWSNWCTYYLNNPLPVTKFEGKKKKVKQKDGSVKKENIEPFYTLASGRLTLSFTPPSKAYSLDSPKLPSQAGSSYDNKLTTPKKAAAAAKKKATAKKKAKSKVVKKAKTTKKARKKSSKKK